MEGGELSVPVEKVGLPVFIYHPDPLADGSVSAREGICDCCGQERGYIYTASVYTPGTMPEEICPWYIADGSAAEKYDATFSDDHFLIRANLPESVIEEVTRRTPGYNSWQGEEWLCCCDDACVFRGDAGREHLLALDVTATEQFLERTGWSPENWRKFIADIYEPHSSPAIYHFTCRHCGKSKYGWDCD